MPPRKRRKTEKDPSKLMAMFAQYAADAGVDLNINQEELREIGDDQALARKIEGDALVYHLAHANEFVMKRCQNCNEPFRTSYYYDGFCSYQCTEQYLRDQYGFVYSGSRPIEERWMFQQWRMAPPMKINPGALKMLEEFARAFLRDLEAFRAGESESESQPTQTQTIEEQIPSAQWFQEELDLLPTERPEYPQSYQAPTQEQSIAPAPLDIEYPDIRLSF